MSSLPPPNLHSHPCALFPGQGSQQIGMGKEFYHAFPIARAVFEEASDAIHIDLKKLCFEGPEEALHLTENTQPCILTTSIAIFRVIQARFDWKPPAAAGHSLGEYSALVAIGSLGLGKTVYWVRERGLAMQTAVPSGEGSMLAILGLEDTQVLELCAQATQIAQENRKAPHSKTYSIPPKVEAVNFNAPGQIVIAGSMDALEVVTQLLRSEAEWRKGKSISLSVSAPFHSSHMQAAKNRMAELFATLQPTDQPKTPTCPYVPNYTAELSSHANSFLQFLTEQIDHPVLWKQSMTRLFDHAFSVFLELGPGKVLSGLAKRIATSIKKPCTTLAIQDPSQLKDLEMIFNQLASRVE